ncbi:MFS transporter [Flavobacterium sp. UBA4197]|uniref:MFS transporter n=1 Tax=Flavobacterium sp. UBA4197 TaxID=1946546 RepID=UPI00257CBB64|nr:MFS transporter [Flavobacterium sp. UBA4197]
MIKNMQEIEKQPLLKNMVLGVAQILLWGGSFFILAILAAPIMEETGWSHQFVYGSLSLALLVSGLLSPGIGRIINQNSTNTVLLYSGIVMGVGLIVIGLSEHVILFLFGWIVVGIAMGMGLYDALFATLGKKKGKEAGKSILQITLISGFAPTVSWPLVSLLLSRFGWRNTCFIYAVLLIIAIYPIHRFVFKADAVTGKTISPPDLTGGKTNAIFRSGAFYLLLANFTIGAVLMTGISIHLIAILRDNNISMVKAISLAALLGPSQVGVWILDLILSEKAPIKTAVMSAIAILLGLLLFFLGQEVAFLGVIFFGMGNGMRSILRGTLPLWLYGQDNYAVIMGKLARLPLIAQAITPFIGGFIIQNFNTTVFLNILCGFAMLNIILIMLLQKSIPHAISE